MKRTPLALTLVLACTATPVRAAELSERGTAMFDAMLGAMDAMGLVERGRKHRSSGDDGDWSSAASGSWGSGMPGSSSFGSWPSAMPGSGLGMPGMSPFGMPGASPFGMPGASAFGMPGSSPLGGFGNPMSPWSSMPLSGGGMPWGGGGMPWTGSGMPWSGGQMPGMPQMPGNTGMPQMPGSAGMPMPSMPSMPWGGSRQKGTASSEFLDGSWEGQDGELLLIRRGMFRIYADAETFRDGHLQVQGDRLQLKDSESGRTREYEMRHQGDQLGLRTPEGEVLLYRRISGDRQGY